MSDCIILSAVSETENDTYVAKYAELVEIKLLRIEKKIIALKVKSLIYLLRAYQPSNAIYDKITYTPKDIICRH